LTISRRRVDLTSLIAPAFYGVHRDIAAGGHTHYWLAGGRGSCKSSFVGVELPLGIMRDAARGQLTSAVAFRRYGSNLRESVYEQLLWALDRLGVSHLWQAGVSPMQMTYRPTGQKILFRGLDDPAKVKSIKAAKGWIKYVWYEEASEIEGMEKIRSVNQSVLRGGADFCVFYTYNPPRAAARWVNREAETARPDRLVHHSTYLDVPPQWLGQTFLAEAEHLRAVSPQRYAHEYLGQVTGSGGEVFTNLVLREITGGEISGFDQLRGGLDWGYAADPLHYARCHYDRTRRRLFIFDELHQTRLSNRAAAELIRARCGREWITCDSAEPKSVDEMKGYGLRVRGAKKGPDSVEYGVKFLQDLEQIVIDPVRCPETAREFAAYELDRDREGNFKAGYPDRDNHSIDAVRYALEEDMTRPGIRILQ